MSNKVLKTALSFLIILFTVLTSFFTVFLFTVKAEDTLPYYDTSSVEDDISEQGISALLPDSLESLTEDVRFLFFLEYGYGTSDYGLYAYVYKSDDVSLDTESVSNKIQMYCASSNNRVYRENVFYSKYVLDCLDVSSNGNYLKFKILGFSCLSFSERYYSISGIELLSTGESNATEYLVGNIYHCKTVNNKTTISRDSLTTLDIDCHHTFYRTNYSVKNDGYNGSNGKGWGNQISSCYFSLPKAFSNGGNYGNLVKILAEFYEYFTKPIVVYGDSDKGYRLTDYINGIRDISGNFQIRSNAYTSIPLGGQGFSAPVYYYLFGSTVNGCSYDHYIRFFNSYNIEERKFPFFEFFYDSNFEVSEDYVFDGVGLENYFISKVEQYMFQGYSRDEAQVLAMNDCFISEEDFSEENLSLTDFTYGYNKHEYSIDQNSDTLAVTGYDIASYTATSFWDRLRELFGADFVEERSLEPIKYVDYEEFIEKKNLSDDVFSDFYCIDKNEVSAFKFYVEEQHSLNKDVYLFRYDACEYFGSFGDWKSSIVQADSEGDCFIGQEMVYLDFDILQFQYEQDGNYTTIPVLHSPEDVWNNLTPVSGYDSCSNLQSLFSILITLFVAVIIWIVITKFIKFLFR